MAVKRQVKGFAIKTPRYVSLRNSDVSGKNKSVSTPSRRSTAASLDELLQEPVDMSIYEGCTLEEVLTGYVKPDEELDWGKPVGKEIW